MKNGKLNKYLWFSGLVVLVMVGVSLFAWGKLPASAEFPVHWGLDGQPDRWGSRFEVLFIMPILASFLMLLQWKIPGWSGQPENLAKSPKGYNIIWLALSLFLLGLHVWTILIALQIVADLVTALAVMMGLMFMVIGNYMGKMRTNGMVGIRTPWTMSSKQSWRKTHRLGGKVFVGVGLMTIVAGLLLEPQGVFMVMLGGLFAGIFALIYYSYYIFKQEEQMTVTQ